MATNNMAIRRIKKELKDIAKSNCGIAIEVLNDNFTKLKGKISGPPDTPYEGGEFILSIEVPEAYPFNPLEVSFVTKIWHPNIDPTDGEVCLDILDKAWAASMTLRTVLLSLQALLQDPLLDDPLDPDVATQSMKYPEMFKLTARYWAQAYAKAPGSNTDFDNKVAKLMDRGISKDDALMALSTHSWNLQKVLKYIVR